MFLVARPGAGQADIHVSLCQGRKRFSWRALRRSAHCWACRNPQPRMCASRRWFLPSQNRTSIHCLRSLRTITEDWVCVLCQSRNNSKRASGVWSPSLSRQPQDLAVCALC